MPKTVTDPWTGEGAEYAETVFVEDKPTHSKLLGPDGKPLMYERHPVGFALKSKKAKAD